MEILRRRLRAVLAPLQKCGYTVYNIMYCTNYGIVLALVQHYMAINSITI